MKRSFNPASVPQAIALESVQVASPCHADWEAMHGDDRSRFCPSCAKNVYNLSAMTRDEAELLLQEKEGRLCVRYFLREDGTMLTQDCPIGVAALKQRSPGFALWAGVASLFVFAGALLSPALMSGANAQPEPKGAPPVPAATATEPEIRLEMGDMVVVPQVKPTTAVAVDPAPRVVKGEASVATPKPTCEPVMGKPAPPAAPKATEIRSTLGRVAVVPSPTATPKPKPSPTPAPTVAPTVAPKPEIPQPLMGLVAISPKPAPAKSTPKKTPSKSKRH